MGLIIFDNPEHRTEDSVMEQYPNCKFVMQVNDLLDTEGLLLAVCDDILFEEEFDRFMNSLPAETKLSVCGWYGEVALGVLHEIKE